MDIYFKRLMKFFKGIKKLLHHLTREENQVPYEQVQETKEPEPVDLPKTEEETNLETQIEDNNVNQLREWAMNKIELLHEADRHRNAKALQAEFEEWINIPEGQDEIEYLCLEDEDWTDDQEVDVR